MNNVGSLLILISAGGRVVRPKDNSKVVEYYRNSLCGAETNEGEAIYHSEFAIMGNPETLSCQRKNHGIAIFQANIVTMVRNHRTGCMRAMGTVLGINHNLIDVCFDTPFSGGTSLML